VPEDFSKVNNAIKDGSFHTNPSLCKDLSGILRRAQRQFCDLN